MLLVVSSLRLGRFDLNAALDEVEEDVEEEVEGEDIVVEYFGVVEAVGGLYEGAEEVVVVEAEGGL